MKVLLLIDSLGSGGAQQQICLLARELRRRGWDVHVLVYHAEFDHFGPFLAGADVSVIRLRKVTRFSLRIPLEVAWHASTGGYHAMLAFLPTPTVYAASARAVGGPPLVASERFTFEGSTPDLASRLVAEAQRLASAVVCNSHHHAARFVAAFPWLRTRTRTIYNGAELATPGAARSVRSPLALLALGTVTPRKNFALLIEALGLLRAQGESLPRIRWAGKLGHAPADRAARGAADRRLQELGVADAWEWLGERADVPQLLADCDALVHASRLEGFPNAIGEALAAGRPVLASDVGDHGRLVRDGVNGFLFDPSSAASIAAVLLRAQRVPAEAWSALGAAARVTAETQLSVGAMADRYARLLEDCAEKREVII